VFAVVLLLRLDGPKQRSPYGAKRNTGIPTKRNFLVKTRLSAGLSKLLMPRLRTPYSALLHTGYLLDFTVQSSATPSNYRVPFSLTNRGLGRKIMNKAGGIIAIIAGIFGIFAAGATLFFGGIGTAVEAERASTVVGLGWGGCCFHSS
jgi:hypothetical protein